MHVKKLCYKKPKQLSYVHLLYTYKILSVCVLKLMVQDN